MPAPTLIIKPLQGPPVFANLFEGPREGLVSNLGESSGKLVNLAFLIESPVYLQVQSILQCALAVLLSHHTGVGMDIFSQDFLKRASNLKAALSPSLVPTQQLQLFRSTRPISIMLYLKAFLSIVLILIGFKVSAEDIQTTCSKTPGPMIQDNDCAAAVNNFNLRSGGINFEDGSPSRSCSSCKVTLSHPYGTPQPRHQRVQRRFVDAAIKKGLQNCAKQSVNSTLVFESGISLSVLLDYGSGAKCHV